jgi:hypothetical protein
MGLHQTLIRDLRALNPSVSAYRTDQYGLVTSIAASVYGIKGGVENVNRGINYRIIINTRNISSPTIPKVWFISPSDEDIEHLNIWGPDYCPDYGRSLPWLCWGQYEDSWRRSPALRSIEHLFRNLAEGLKTQNVNSATQYRKTKLGI